MEITVTDVLAITSLIIATASFVLSYLNWKDDKPRLKLSYFMGKVYRDGVGDIGNIIRISVSNKGKRPVTVNKQIALICDNKKGFIILYEKGNYHGDLSSQNERIEEFSSINIILNLDSFIENEIDINTVKGLSLSDSLGNSHFLKLKSEDKKKIRNLREKSK